MKATDLLSEPIFPMQKSSSIDSIYAGYLPKGK